MLNMIFNYWWTSLTFHWKNPMAQLPLRPRPPVFRWFETIGGQGASSRRDPQTSVSRSWPFSPHWRSSCWCRAAGREPGAWLRILWKCDWCTWENRDWGVFGSWQTHISIIDIWWYMIRIDPSIYPDYIQYIHYKSSMIYPLHIHYISITILPWRDMISQSIKIMKINPAGCFEKKHQCLQKKDEQWWTTSTKFLDIPSGYD